MKLTELTNDDSEIAWIGPEINHGDWPFRFLLKIEYTEEWGEDVAKNGKYLASIESVSPAAAGEKGCRDACRCHGLDYEDQFLSMDHEWQCKILSEYGTKATLWSQQGHNMRKLKKEALHQLAICGMMFGFMMDRPVNAIGSTGWDVIAGDLLAGLNRPSDRPENELMQKLQEDSNNAS